MPRLVTSPIQVRHGRAPGPAVVARVRAAAAADGPLVTRQSPPPGLGHRGDDSLMMAAPAGGPGPRASESHHRRYTTIITDRDGGPSIVRRGRGSQINLRGSQGGFRVRSRQKCFCRGGFSAAADSRCVCGRVCAYGTSVRLWNVS